MYPEVVGVAAAALLRQFPKELFERGFYLAGGTGLALQLGHRASDDFDFFTTSEFAADEIEPALARIPGFAVSATARGTVHGRAGGVKLTFLHFAVPLRFPLLAYEGAPVADWRDILADKFKTVAQRGSRKDFYDIHACCAVKGISPAEAVGFVRDRFGATGLNLYHLARSLVWFEDAESEPEPVLLRPVSWAAVKAFFVENLAEFESALTGAGR